MSKLVNGYIAEFLTADVSVGKDIIDYSEDLGKRGQLTVWESENLHPGQKYIRFRPDDNRSEMQTSCGEISISKDRFTICTQGGANTYTFKLIEHIQTIDFRLRLPERFWHICNSCGKREILSSKEAFEQGWDYPGPDGIYKDAPNHGFRMFAPRKCGDCSIIDSFYWKSLNGKEQIDINEQSIVEMFERVMNEPWSLLTSERDEDV